MPCAAHSYFTLCLTRSLKMLFLHENLYPEIEGDRLNWGSAINLAYQALILASKSFPHCCKSPISSCILYFLLVHWITTSKPFCWGAARKFNAVFLKRRHKRAKGHLQELIWVVTYALPVSDSFLTETSNSVPGFNKKKKNQFPHCKHDGTTHLVKKLECDATGKSLNFISFVIHSHALDL